MSLISSVTKVVTKIGNGIVKHSPSILTGLGCAGVISTAVMSAKAVEPAKEVINLECRHENIVPEDLSLYEKFKKTWNLWMPAIVSGATSIACIIGANVINLKRGAALAALYTLSQEQLTEYRHAVREKLGEKKAKDVEETVALKKGRSIANDNVIVTGKGDYLFKDLYTGCVFRSDVDKVRSAFLDLNDQMWKEGYVSVTDLKYCLNIRNKQGKMDDELGWRVENGKIEYTLTADFDEELKEPVMYIKYNLEPIKDYYKFGG